jgi:hypothetical protein
MIDSFENTFGNRYAIIAAKAKRTDRKVARSKSNNPHNPNQNICVQEVAKFFGVADEVRYLHKMEDLVRAIRIKYTVRSRESQVRGKTVGKMREKLPKLAQEVNAIAFIARVAHKNGSNGHVIALDATGKTFVDTDPRKRDKRLVTHLYVIYK